MDADFFVPSLQSKHLNLWSKVLAEFGQLQAQFMRGDDVLPHICTVLAELSQSSCVLVADINTINNPEMPESAACWCQDPVRFLSLWKEACQWPFLAQQPLVHCWGKFIVWPLIGSDTLIFFRDAPNNWLEFLMEHQLRMSQSMQGMMNSKRRYWCEQDVQMFQAVVSNSEDLILVISSAAYGQSKIIYANKAATEISQYSSGQLLGEKVDILFDQSPELSDAQQALLGAINDGSDYGAELWITKSDGERALLNIHLMELDIKDESRIFALIGRDRTEQKKMQKVMIRTQKMQAIGQLVGGIAHDFNNILGVLKGNVELMQLKNRDEKLEKYLNTGLKACQRGTDLTRRLLQFSRQEQFNACNCDVNEVISGLEDLFAKSLTSSVTLTAQLEKDLSQIWVDKGDLEDALLNLAINARDAMAGEGELIIRTGEEQMSGILPGAGGNIMVEKGAYVWISVIDTGAGIPPHLLEKIYEPFFTTKDKSKGTGLGLAMIYGFVKRSAGYMSVLQTGSHGTEFRLWFPVSQHQQQNKAQVIENNVPSEDILSEIVSKPIKAILVDDEIELLQVLKGYCDILGIEVESYNDPHVVSEKYTQGGCDADLLITDVLMPGGINGYELAKSLQSGNPSLEVLLISGFIHDIGISKQEEMPYQVLNKPFELQGLIEALKQIGIRFNHRETK